MLLLKSPLDLDCVCSLKLSPSSSSQAKTASVDADDGQEIVSAHVLRNPTVVATSGMANQYLNGRSARPAVVKTEPAGCAAAVASPVVLPTKGLLHVSREDVKAEVTPLGVAGAGPG